MGTNLRPVKDRFMVPCLIVGLLIVGTITTIFYAHFCAKKSEIKRKKGELLRDHITVRAHHSIPTR